MRIVSSTNAYNDKSITNPSFGMDFTKSTIEFLKKSVPRLIRTDEDFVYTQKAISNFAELAKRNDDFLLDYREIYSGSVDVDLSNMSISRKKNKLKGPSLHEQVVDWVINNKNQDKRGLDAYVSSVFPKIAEDFDDLKSGNPKDQYVEKLFSDFNEQKIRFEKEGKVPYSLKCCYYFWDMFSQSKGRRITPAQDLFNLSEYLKTNTFIDRANTLSNNSNSESIKVKILSALDIPVQKAKNTYCQIEDFINYFGYHKKEPVNIERQKQIISMINDL